MSTETRSDIAIGPDWTDITSVDPMLWAVDICIQSKAAYGDDLYIVFGGEDPPDAVTAGAMLDRFDSVSGNAENIWVRCDKPAKIGITLL